MRNVCFGGFIEACRKFDDADWLQNWLFILNWLQLKSSSLDELWSYTRTQQKNIENEPYFSKPSSILHGTVYKLHGFRPKTRQNASWSLHKWHNALWLSMVLRLLNVLLVIWRLRSLIAKRTRNKDKDLYGKRLFTLFFPNSEPTCVLFLINLKINNSSVAWLLT